LEELAEALQSHSEVTIPEGLLDGTPPEHGRQRFRDGFDIEEVVAEYNILRGCVCDLADRNEIIIRGQSFHILNQVLDKAIGLAVQTYATQSALEIKQRREEYLAFVAHDLRTPLSAISLSATVLTMLIGEQANQPDTAQILATLDRSVEQLKELVAKVLQENIDISKGGPEKLERRWLFLWPLVEGVVRDLGPVSDIGSCKLINEVPGDMRVYADAGLLTRIFQNLVSNAIRYAPHGEVRVGARQKDANGAIECWVTDNGAGIPADSLDKVFDKHESDPSHSDGFGLGLAIVKEAIEAHGGTIEVQSQENVGSTFRFTLTGKQE
jgi:two-component system phosphate regulon sensor histidine kinase PhoR